MGKGKLVAKVIERARAGYEIEEVEYGKVYRWQPETILVECECGEETTLTHSEAACEECGTEHAGLIREDLSELQLGDDENIPPGRYWGEGQDGEALP